MTLADQGSRALQSTAASGLSPAITSVHDFAKASWAEATRRAYQGDWADFTAWCGACGATFLPAPPATVGAYLADLASDHKVATIQRRLASINAAHRLAGETSPTSTEEVRLVLQGIRRLSGVVQDQVRAVTLDELRRMVVALPDDLAGSRDRALLLVGFAGAFRRSELVALDVDDLGTTEDGVIVNIRRSKTDQVAAGRQVGLPYGSSPKVCPVSFLRHWLEMTLITSGPVFRKVDRHGHLGTEQLSPSTVAQVVKRAAALAGLDATVFSGHSLRAGLATAAAANGATETMIMAQTGHRSTAMVRRYIRRGNLFRQNAATIAGL
jgi:integrase